MSFSADPLIVTCDGAGCANEARLPVALRPQIGTPTGGAAAAPGAIAGWLFVTAQERSPRHYCPRCTPFYLRGILPAVRAAGRPETYPEPAPERKDPYGC